MLVNGRTVNVFVMGCVTAALAVLASGGRYVDVKINLNRHQADSKHLTVEVNEIMCFSLWLRC